MQTEGQSGKRRIKYHEFPHRDAPFAEDLGEGRRSYKFTAYVDGDDAGDKAQTLIAALSSKGAGPLVLPLSGRVQATCPEWSSSFEKDRMGRVAFDLSFERDMASGLGGLLPLPMLGRLTEVALDNLQAPLTTAFSSVFQGVGVADFVNQSSAGLIGDLAVNMQSLRIVTPLKGVVSAALKTGISSLLRGAPKLAGSGSVGDLVNATGYIRQAVNIPHELPARVFTLMGDFLEGVERPLDGVNLFKKLSRFETSALLNQKTANRRVEYGNHRAVESLVRRAALGHMAVAATRVNYKTRSAAITAKADIAELFEMDIMS